MISGRSARLSIDLAISRLKMPKTIVFDLAPHLVYPELSEARNKIRRLQPRLRRDCYGMRAHQLGEQELFW